MARGRRTEIGAINGQVVALARERGMAVPYAEAVLDLVRVRGQTCGRVALLGGLPCLGRPRWSCLGDYPLLISRILWRNRDITLIGSPRWGTTLSCPVGSPLRRATHG